MASLSLSLINYGKLFFLAVLRERPQCLTSSSPRPWSGPLASSHSTTVQNKWTRKVFFATTFSCHPSHIQFWKFPCVGELWRLTAWASLFIFFPRFHPLGCISHAICCIMLGYYISPLMAHCQTPHLLLLCTVPLAISRMSTRVIFSHSSRSIAIILQLWVSAQLRLSPLGPFVNTHS